MRDRRPRERPRPWHEERAAAASSWAIPIRRLNWWLEWVSWALSHWALLDVLDHLGTFSVLIAVVFYFGESDKRVKQRHYQAWQVINTAQGKGGSGGRVEALQELNDDHVSLIVVDASGAFLRGLRLQRAHLERCDLQNADLRNGDFAGAELSDGNLRGTNLREANLENADLQSADLQDADLNQANLSKANFAHTDLSRADLRFIDLRDAGWREIHAMKLANIYGIRNAPPEFLLFAQKQGAVSIAEDEKWNALLDGDASASVPTPSEHSK